MLLQPHQHVADDLCGGAVATARQLQPARAALPLVLLPELLLVSWLPLPSALWPQLCMSEGSDLAREHCCECSPVVASPDLKTFNE